MILGGALASGTGRAIQQLRDLSQQIRGDLWARWIGIAQRRVLLRWKSRRIPPGVAARFTVAGASYYRFGSRQRKPSSILPYYHITGSLERLVTGESRKPHTSRRSGNVVTRIAFGGGYLNFMTENNSRSDMRPVVGWTRRTRSITESFNVASYTRSTRSGSQIAVNSYSMTRTRQVSKSLPVRGGDSHAAAFGNLVKDRPWLEAAVAVELRRIVRRSAIDKRTGQIKSSVLANREAA